MEIRKVLLFVICFGCVTLSYGQDQSEDYTLKKSWSFGFGLASNTIDEEMVTLSEWDAAYTSLNLPDDDYSGWGTDDYISSEGALLPTAFNVEFSAPFSKAKSDWWKNTVWSNAVSVGYSECYKGNMEKMIGNTSVGSVFSRELYYLTADATMWSYHTNMFHLSRHYGKKKRLRFGFGIGLSFSAIKLDAYLYHVQGTYASTGEGMTYHPWHIFPADEITHSWSLIGSASGRLMGMGFDVPLSVEFLVGRKKRTHLGFLMYVGKSYNNKVNGLHLNMTTMTGLASIRFDLK